MKNSDDLKRDHLDFEVAIAIKNTTIDAIPNGASFTSVTFGLMGAVSEAMHTLVADRESALAAFASLCIAGREQLEMLYDDAD